MKLPTPNNSSTAVSSTGEPDFGTLLPDVQPLDSTNRYYPPMPSPNPRKTRHPPGPDADHHTAPELGEYQNIEQDYDQSFMQSGLPTRTLRRLRKGHWRCVAELDLHGLDRYQAQAALATFVHRHPGHCVRIIHGKGYRSAGQPILKHITYHWLKNQPNVLAFCQASAQAGGSGALVVLLK